MIASMAIKFMEAKDHATPLPFRLRGIGIEHRQEPIKRPFGYPLYQWIQVRKGEARVETINGISIARRGDGFFLRPHEAHGYHDLHGGTELIVDWMNFDGTSVEEVLAVATPQQSGVYRLATPERIHQWFADAWDMCNDPAIHSRRQFSWMVYKLLMELAEAAAPPGQTTISDDAKRLLPLITILNERCAESWTVESMAGLLCMSPQHLGRLFRRGQGQSPRDFLISLRLDRARNLLLERPELRIHEVAEAVGYDDSNHFIRRFKLREGCTPSQFRNLHQA